MLVLHKLFRDGRVEHEDFVDRETWYRALRDPEIAMRWAHLPGDCEHPAEKVRKAFLGQDTSLGEVTAELCESGMGDIAGRSSGVPKLVFGERDRILGQVEQEHRHKPKIGPKPRQGSLF